MREEQLREINAKSILHYHKRTFATNWDANIYRGCEHNCIYCFAQYTHNYLPGNNFFKDIFVKSNASELLHKELGKKNWIGNSVNVCGISDCYQPAEKEYKIMPKVIKSFIARKNSIVIMTKSILILRDIELIKELNKVAEVSIIISVSTLDEEKRILIEPNASPTIERIKMLKVFSELGIKTSVLLMPIIPYLTDTKKNLDEIFKITSEYDLGSITTSALHLRGRTKNVFYDFLGENYPELLPKYKKIYISGDASKEYKIYLQNKIDALRKKYKLYSVYKSTEPKFKKEVQMSIFD